MAHKFADEIIVRLGGGVQGIAETQIYFVSDRTGHKEIWAMDYDGSNQHQITRMGSIALSPRVSPDGLAARLQRADQEWLGHHDVLARHQSTREFPALRRHEFFSCLVE